MIYTYTPKRLIAGSALTNALATYYTNASAYGAILKELVLVNTDTVARTVSVHIVPLSGTAGVPSTLLSNVSLIAGEEKTYSFFSVIPLGSFIQASASAGAVVAINASGLEIS